ncbi:MAG: flagellar filament capping protein FliD [Fimbriimonadales bacterium]
MIGGNLTGINFSGLATGIDSEAIIQKLAELQARPLQRLMVRKSELQARMSAFDQFRGLINNLQTAAGALSTRNAFTIVRANSSDSQVATLTGSTDALPGTYDVRVRRLAQAHKIVSDAHTSATADLGVNGQIMVNGKVVSISATDTLTSVASKINAANAGVTASILRADSGQFYLTLTANETGENSRIQLAEVGGNLILVPSLKLVSYDQFVREQRDNSAFSMRFRNSTNPVGTELNLQSPPSGTIQINGIGVNLDLATDSLTTIVGKINSAGIPGVTASLETETVNGTTFQKIKITGSSGTPTFVDDNNILTNLGILQNQYQQELVQAQDAEFTIDGFQFRRSRNTIDDAIQGTTITLHSADVDNPKRATLTLTRDTEATRNTVNNFVNAFNSLVDFLKQNASIDRDSLRTGPLFGDTTVGNIRDGLIQRIIDAVPNLQGDLRVLAQVGIQLGQDGKLSLNESVLNRQLNENLQEVIQLFTANGRTTNDAISFISSTDSTRPSPPGGYEVVITQVATRATATASVAQTSASTQTENLTFSGALFGNQNYTLQIAPGSTIDDTINRINNDARLRNLVVARQDNAGRLVIEARNYGSAANFRVVSNLAAGSDNSGIGTGGIDAEGLDVAGTINGEAATGRGQFLTGNSNNPNTAGLQIRVNATSPGTYGVVHFTRGASDRARLFARQVTDIVNGDITLARNTLNDQMKAIDEQVEAIRQEVSRRQLMLREQFARMERMVSQMQAQGARLSAMAAAFQTGISTPQRR